MTFVIRTEKLSSPHYWTGITFGNVGHCHAITPVIWNAWHFEDRADAEKIIAEHLGDDWAISVVGAVKASKSLRKRH